MKNIYVCADLHINADDNYKRDLLLKLINDLTEEDELIIAGDLFEVFIGDVDLQLSWQKEILSNINASVKSGRKISYVEGNRDYFISELSNNFFYEVQRQILYRFDGKVAIVHGDLINKKDKLYFLWRIISRRKIMLKIIKCFPEYKSIKFIYWLEKRMRSLNKKYKNYIPFDEIRKYISKREVELIVSGHFHKFIKLSLNGKLFICIPSWNEHPNILKIWFDNGAILHKLMML